MTHAICVSDSGARIEVAVERMGNEAVLRVTDLHAAGAALPAPGDGANGANGDGAPRFDPQTLNAILEEHHGRLAIEHLEPQGTAYLATLPIRAVSTEILPRLLKPRRPSEQALRPSSSASRYAIDRSSSSTTTRTRANRCVYCSSCTALTPRLSTARVPRSTTCARAAATAGPIS